MKYILTLLLLLNGLNSEAITPGSLDTSFNYIGDSLGYEYLPLEGDRGSAVFVDYKQRVYVLGPDKSSDKVLLYRFLPDGSLDTDYSIYAGALQIQKDMQNSYRINGDTKAKAQIIEGDNNSVYVAYSVLAGGGVDVHNDIYILHIDESGFVIDDITFGLDAEYAPLFAQDYFADMVYLSGSQKLIVASSAHDTSGGDADFGVTVINDNGTLSIDNTFNSDGRDLCAFNQQEINGNFTGDDYAESVVMDTLTNHIIIAGSAYEGNGLNGNGWNLAFCEYSFSGLLIRKWSTEPLPDGLFDIELLKDVVYVQEGSVAQGNLSSNLIVSGMVVGSGGYDFALTKYKLTASGWQIDTTFGAAANGWTTTPFSINGVGTTDDRVRNMNFEPQNGSFTVAGFASWDDGSNPFGLKREAVILAKYDNQGVLLTGWGESGNGYSIHQFNPVFGEGVYSSAMDPVSESLFTVGKSQELTGDYSNQITIAKFHNDLIFSSNFD